MLDLEYMVAFSACAANPAALLERLGTWRVDHPSLAEELRNASETLAGWIAPQGRFGE